MPRGWYRIGPPDSLQVGDIVLTRLPADAAALAAQRGYLPAGVPLLKRIGAMSPQRVCIMSDVVRIDGLAQATVLMADGSGRPLPVWEQCGTLDQESFVAAAGSNSGVFEHDLTVH